MVNHRRKQHIPEWTGKDHEIFRWYNHCPGQNPQIQARCVTDRLSHSMIQGYH
jgi:hypothetical protein